AKREARMRRHSRVRRKVRGTAERPRLVVYRSNRHIYAQLVDDLSARTLVATSDLAVGDGNKTARAKKVGQAIAEGARSAGVEGAKKSMFQVPLMNTTIPHEVRGEDGAGIVMLKPAAPGTGVIAGGPVRAVVEAAGIKDILSKSLGSDNPINIVHAAIAGLRRLKRPEEIARLRGRDVSEIAPRPMVEGVADAEVAMAAKRAQAGAEVDGGEA